MGVVGAVAAGAVAGGCAVVAVGRVLASRARRVLDSTVELDELLGRRWLDGGGR